MVSLNVEMVDNSPFPSFWIPVELRVLTGRKVETIGEGEEVDLETVDNRVSFEWFGIVWVELLYSDRTEGWFAVEVDTKVWFVGIWVEVSSKWLESDDPTVELDEMGEERRSWFSNEFDEVDIESCSLRLVAFLKFVLNESIEKESKPCSFSISLWPIIDDTTNNNNKMTVLNEILPIFNF